MQITTIWQAQVAKYKTLEAPEPSLNEANTIAPCLWHHYNSFDVTENHTYGKAATVPSATRKINGFLLELSC